MSGDKPRRRDSTPPEFYAKLDEGFPGVVGVKPGAVLPPRVQAVSERRPIDIGRFVSRDSVQGGVPCFASTRIPVSVVWELHDAGHSAEAICEEYPSLYPEDVEAAIRLPRPVPKAKERALPKHGDPISKWRRIRGTTSASRMEFRVLNNKHESVSTVHANAWEVLPGLTCEVAERLAAEERAEDEQKRREMAAEIEASQPKPRPEGASTWCEKCGAADPPRQFDGFADRHRGHYLDGGPPADCGPVKTWAPPREDLPPPSDSGSWLAEARLGEDPCDLLREEGGGWPRDATEADVVASFRRAVKHAEAVRLAAVSVYHHCEFESAPDSDFGRALWALFDLVAEDAPDCRECRAKEAAR